MGYIRTEADHAVFTRAGADAPSIIALYVDDVTMVASDLASIDRDKEALNRSYEMTDLGELSWILGMQMKRKSERGFGSEEKGK
jgi:hypothetical protein